MAAPPVATFVSERGSKGYVAQPRWKASAFYTNHLEGICNPCRYHVLSCPQSSWQTHQKCCTILNVEVGGEQNVSMKINQALP